MSKKVALCAGHGGNGSTPGKRTPDGEYEWTFNDKVVRAAIPVLEAAGVQVKRMDDASGKTDVPLSVRTNKANQWGADIYWSSHHNAFQGVWGDHTGSVTFTQTGSYKESERLAKCVHPRIVKAMGLYDRGTKKMNLHITRETRMPAILTEGGFMDSRIDIKALRDDARLKAQGEAIAAGILEYFGIASNGKTATTKPKKQRPTVKPATRPKARTQISVDGKWGKETTREVQKALGTPVDGIISRQLRNNVTQALYGSTVQYGKGGSPMMRALQRKVGAKVDGYLGPETVRALQRYLGTPQDGVISQPSSVMVRELQRRLNAGTF